MIASQRKLVIAGLIGNVLEWYDFSVYGYFAVSIGHHFFPSENPTTSLLAAFGVFAAGFLMRPVARSCLDILATTGVARERYRFRCLRWPSRLSDRGDS